MCLYEAKRIKLDKDLTVYKVMHPLTSGDNCPSFTTPFQNTYIELDECKVYTAEYNLYNLTKTDTFQNFSEMIINDHYIETYPYIKNGKDFLKISSGVFHSFEREQDAFLECILLTEKWKNPPYVVVECVIPKESIVFKGKYREYNSYASTQLKFIRIV